MRADSSICAAATPERLRRGHFIDGAAMDSFLDSAEREPRSAGLLTPSRIVCGLQDSTAHVHPRPFHFGEDPFAPSWTRRGLSMSFFSYLIGHQLHRRFRVRALLSLPLWTLSTSAQRSIDRQYSLMRLPDLARGVLTRIRGERLQLARGHQGQDVADAIPRALQQPLRYQGSSCRELFPLHTPCFTQALHPGYSESVTAKFARLAVSRSRSLTHFTPVLTGVQASGRHRCAIQADDEWAGAWKGDDHHER